MSDDIDAAVLDAIAADLRDARGHEQAITSAELADRHLPDDSSGQPQTRKAVKALMRERGLPVIGTNEGYFIPDSREPIDDAIDTLDHRIDGIRERKRLLERNWADWRRRSLRADGGERATGQELTDDEIEQIKSDPVLQLSDFETATEVASDD